MDLGLGNTHLSGDPRLVDHIVGEVKSQGIFDQFRKECIADVDTKPAYQNLRTRVESSVNSFLGKQTWKADLNKNQLRETLRKHIVEAPYLDAGVERIVDQVVNPKVYSVFMPQIEDVVYKFLGLERPKNRQKNGPCGFKDLLPKDLDPVSPVSESDKNSLKDVSLDSVDAIVVDSVIREKETFISGVEKIFNDDANDENNDNDNGGNNVDGEIKLAEDSIKSSTVPNLNCTGKSEEKTEEEEEDSPTFEPIDIMNLNESNVSNDSHLSGISELTSHRSRSPDFSNDASRENMDFSNQDSQFSKVSSDSRLSIVTDFGSSNHGSTPVSDALKDDKNETKYAKDNFRAVRDFDCVKVSKDVGKLSCECSERSKEDVGNDFKAIGRGSSSKETSRDGTETVAKDFVRNDSKSRKSDGKDSKKEREKDNRRKLGNHDSRSAEKWSKKMIKDRGEEKSREREKDREKKETEKKEKPEVGKESKDLKDLYKEKIRELREKKELTEKEKLFRDKDSKTSKDGTRDKRDSSRDKRDSKEHKSSSSSSSKISNRSDGKNSKSGNSNDGKLSRSESRDKNKRDDRKYSKDYKSKSCNAQSDEKLEKRISRTDEKTEKSNVKETKEKMVKKDGKNGDKRESKSETDKDKKRRDDKKTKTKDDHSCMRKNSEDRRSTDRDGSNGSNGKSSQKSGSSSVGLVPKSSGSNVAKESTNTSNSSSETSDSIEESQNEKLGMSCDANDLNIGDKISMDRDSQAKKLDLGQNEICLPIKKRPFGEDGIVVGNADEITMKKPKFAKNFQEAKRLMKIRRKIEKEKMRRQQETMKNVVEAPTIPEIRENVDKNDLELVPDDERVQIIEVCDEEYDEPYPEIQSDFTLEERSQIILGGESIFTSELPLNRSNVKSTLSEMELSIRESLNEMITDKNVDDAEIVPKTERTTSEESEKKINDEIDCAKEISFLESKNVSNAEQTSTKDLAESKVDEPEMAEITTQLDDNEKMDENKDDHEIRNQNNVDDEIGNENNADNEIRTENKIDDEIRNENKIDDEIRNENKVDDEIRNENKVDEEIRKENVADDEIRKENVVDDEIRKENEIDEEIRNENEVDIEIRNENKIDEEIRKENKVDDEIHKENKVDDQMHKENKVDDEIRTKDESIISKAEDPKIEKISESSDKNDDTNRKFVDEKIETSEAPLVELQPTSPTISPEVPSSNKTETEPRQSISEITSKTCDDPETNVRDSSAIVDEDPAYLSDDVPCLYFTQDNEKFEKFTKFMKAFEKDEDSSGEEIFEAGNSTICSETNDVVSSLSKFMAPPKPKRKYSTSPLTDILLNNTNNNNDGHKINSTIGEDDDATNVIKKRKIGRPKKQRSSGSLCGQHNLLNGENFVMPLSPESDVSATSEKTPSNPLKDEKSRPRGSNQRYTSDDLYKPRPLFASSSRRSRRSNPA